MPSHRWSVLALLVIAANTAAGQTAGSAQPVYSMGQPPLWEPYLAYSRSFGHSSQNLVGAFTGGVYKAITNPVTGVFGVAAEGLVSDQVDTAGRWRPSARIFATSRALGLAAGVNYDGGFGPAVQFQTAVRRGGFFGHGTMVRLDWLPKSERQFFAGIQLPVGQPFAGRTRVRRTDADLGPSERARLTAGPLPREAEAALTRIGYAATQILAYTNLYSEDTSIVRYGRSWANGMRSYRDEITAAFRAVAHDRSLGSAIAERARAGLLDDVILPFDSLFGQAKKGGIRGFTMAAQGRFLVWLRDSSGVADSLQPAVATVHARWLEIVEAVHGHLLAQWRDSRLVWLPLQLALTEEQYDEQTEVDRLVERAVGRPFTDRNALTYLRSSDLPLEIARSIFAARKYHVVWLHDFTGRREITKEMDQVGFTMVADAYLPALTQAVMRYDSTGQMPVYMILHDEFFYSDNDGRLWLTILEDPLNARIRLPGRNAENEKHLRGRQEELRKAVANSRRLQREAAEQGGRNWLRRVVKVHVSIVLPSDFSFRSNRIIPGLPFIPDNIQRDHRKVVFYDITESNPYAGAAMVMGVGIGEHYASATWEDRGYRVRGPAALEVRAAARRALQLNGVAGNKIPLPLLVDGPRPAADSQGGKDYVGRALQLHNEAGFGTKSSSVARAMLYNLAPPGSVIIVPDPLWVSETWAAMLAGAAARGCRVYVISPSVANAPNPQAVVFAMQHNVMLRMLEIRERIGPQIRAVGGELRVGLYTARAEVTDTLGRRLEIQEGLRRAPWIRQLIPFDAATLAVLNRATAKSETDGKDATAIAHDERPRAPQLHQKTQLIARPGAIAALVRQPGWDDLLAHAMAVQSQQTAKFADQLGWTTPDVDSSATSTADAMLRGYEQALSDADRKAVSFYFSLGSQNMDPRGIMQDGETSILVSGVHAATGLVDLYYIMARSTWIERPAELEQLLPKPRGLTAKIARIIRLAL